MTSLSYRMLQIAGAPAGFLGLEELFQELYAQELDPNAQYLRPRLLRELRKNNFIPKPAENEYGNALALEYARFYKSKKQGKAWQKKDYGQWRGYPREQIPWFPTIAPQLCNNCAACMETCARDVYEKDEDGHIWVAEPFQCMVGCCFCKSVCSPQALLFPSQNLLNNYREKI
ncbi:MAG: hypothetical protein VB108_00140 [Anaerolineaceae bacterium]|nr:hypothetical protein [Anaerolineaceae bacterium]